MVYCLCCVCFTFVSSIIIFFFNVMLVDQVVHQGFDVRKQIQYSSLCEQGLLIWDQFTSQVSLKHISALSIQNTLSFYHINIIILFETSLQ